MRMLHKRAYLSIAALFLAFSASAQEGGKDANNLNFTQFSSELKPSSETRFNIAGREGPVVEFKSSGGKTELLLSRNNRKPETFERVDAFEPGAGQLSDFAGSYYSEELNTTYKMSVEEAKLVVIDRHGAKRPLTPTIRDSFVIISGPQFEFSRDAAGKVSGFAIHAGRIRIKKKIR